MALIIDIADAVAAELAGGEFSQTFTPRRQVLPSWELADLKDLRIAVVPRAVEISRASRATGQHDLQVDVGIQKKVGRDTDADVATLLGLVEEVADFLAGRRLAAFPQAAWVRTDNEPVYAPDHLAEQRVFTSVLTLTYRVMR